MFENMFPKRPSKIEKHQDSILVTRNTNANLEINQAMNKALKNSNSAASKTNKIEKHQDSILVTQNSRERAQIHQAIKDAVTNTASNP